jgi:hypothetical protein
MRVPVGVLGRIRSGPEAGRFVEVTEDRVNGCLRVFSYADRARSAEILDGVFVSLGDVERYLVMAGWELEWLPDA